jgi:hypothetical protein
MTAAKVGTVGDNLTRTVGSMLPTPLPAFAPGTNKRGVDALPDVCRVHCDVGRRHLNHGHLDYAADREHRRAGSVLLQGYTGGRLPGRAERGFYSGGAAVMALWSDRDR